MLERCFRCGFLGLLHMEIVQERLEREYGLSILATLPSVEYLVHTAGGELVTVDNPADGQLYRYLILFFHLL